jgi:hypothetical protein
MAKDITEILKEATKGILTEDTLKEIKAVFSTAVDDKVKIHVEKALVEQDEDYSDKLKTLLEAVDADHVGKLNKIVEAIDHNHAAKFRTVCERYDRIINKEAEKFKKNLVETVSNYLDLYIDEKIPTTTLEEAVKNRRAVDFLDEIRAKLSVDMALSNESIREAVADGKRIIEEQAQAIEEKEKALKEITEKFENTSGTVILEQKISDFDPKKKTRIRKLVEGKSGKYITENFDYIVSLMDKTEEEHIELLKEEATKDAEATKVDRVIEESSEETGKTAEKNNHPPINTYMTELQKF